MWFQILWYPIAVDWNKCARFSLIEKGYIPICIYNCRYYLYNLSKYLTPLKCRAQDLSYLKERPVYRNLPLYLLFCPFCLCYILKDVEVMAVFIIYIPYWR